MDASNSSQQGGIVWPNTWMSAVGQPLYGPPSASLVTHHPPHSPAIPSPLHVVNAPVPVPNPIYNLYPTYYHHHHHTPPGPIPSLVYQAPPPPTAVTLGHAPSTTRNPAPSTKLVELRNWFISVMRSGNIVVLGNRDGEWSSSKVWRSSPIAERLSPSIVVTKSKTVYHLVGGLDREEMQNCKESLPISDAIVKKFQYGFPRNWPQLVQLVLLEEEERDMTAPTDPVFHSTLHSPALVRPPLQKTEASTPQKSFSLQNREASTSQKSFSAFSQALNPRREMKVVVNPLMMKASSSSSSLKLPQKATSTRTHQEAAPQVSLSVPQMVKAFPSLKLPQKAISTTRAHQEVAPQICLSVPQVVKASSSPLKLPQKAISTTRAYQETPPLASLSVPLATPTKARRETAPQVSPMMKASSSSMKLSQKATFTRAHQETAPQIRLSVPQMVNASSPLKLAQKATRIKAHQETACQVLVSPQLMKASSPLKLPQRATPTKVHQETAPQMTKTSSPMKLPQKATPTKAHQAKAKTPSINHHFKVDVKLEGNSQDPLIPLVCRPATPRKSASTVNSVTKFERRPLTPDCLTSPTLRVLSPQRDYASPTFGSLAASVSQRRKRTRRVTESSEDEARIDPASLGSRPASLGTQRKQRVEVRIDPPSLGTQRVAEDKVRINPASRKRRVTESSGDEAKTRRNPIRRRRRQESSEEEVRIEPARRKRRRRKVAESSEDEEPFSMRTQPASKRFCPDSKAAKSIYPDPISSTLPRINPTPSTPVREPGRTHVSASSSPLSLTLSFSRKLLRIGSENPYGSNSSKSLDPDPVSSTPPRVNLTPSTQVGRKAGATSTLVSAFPRPLKRIGTQRTHRSSSNKSLNSDPVSCSPLRVDPNSSTSVRGEAGATLTLVSASPRPLKGSGTQQTHRSSSNKSLNSGCSPLRVDSTPVGGEAGTTSGLVSASPRLLKHIGMQRTHRSSSNKSLNSDPVSRSPLRVNPTPTTPVRGEASTTLGLISAPRSSKSLNSDRASLNAHSTPVGDKEPSRKWSTLSLTSASPKPLPQSVDAHRRSSSNKSLNSDRTPGSPVMHSKPGSTFSPLHPLTQTSKSLNSASPKRSIGSQDVGNGSKKLFSITTGKPVKFIILEDDSSDDDE